MSENGKEQALLTAKEMLGYWKIANCEEQKRTNYTSNYFSSSSYDAVSLRMEQTLSEVASIDSGGVLPDASSHSHASGNNNAANKSMWSLQLHIWILVIELFIKLNQVMSYKRFYIRQFSKSFHFIAF